MKNFHLGFSTLICLSVLFTLVSCTTDILLVSSDTIDKEDSKKKNSYYTTRKGHLVPVAENLSTYACTTEIDDNIDQDWKKLIAHFIGTNRFRVMECIF